MATLNVKVKNDAVTHEGAPAAKINARQALRRSVLACMLWEKEFYESGEEIAERILRLAQEVMPEEVAAIAIEAREVQNLRHAPLLLVAALAKVASGNSVVRRTVARVIQRADELPELIAIIAKINKVEPGKVKKHLSAQVKKGIAAAFKKFDEYQLAKYDRGGAVRLRDAMFLSHPRPLGPEQAALWLRLSKNELATPDTWEVELSAGKDKKVVFERLLIEGKLGYMALLRNLRNMVQAGVDEPLIAAALSARKGADRVLPFRYVAAARAVPQLEPLIDKALLASLERQEPLPGKTVVLVDVSSSMVAKLSGRSDMTRTDAAAALAVLVPGDVRVFSFSDEVVEVPRRPGMAGIDAIQNSQPNHGTRLFDAVAKINATVPYDRLIVITDEQAHAASVGYYIQGEVKTMPAPKGRGYVINVASNQNGVGYGPWTHIDGWSEACLKFIAAHEAAPVAD